MSWIKINRQTLGLDSIEHQASTRGGTSGSWRISPFDVPEAMQIAMSQDHKRISLKLKYLNEEADTELDNLGSGVELIRGVETKRVYEILIILGNDSVESTLDRALQSAAQKIIEVAVGRSSNQVRGLPRSIGSLRTQVAGTVLNRYVDCRPDLEGIPRVAL